ncbi:hypothetical protein N7522_002346 [Penicillium canescens]|nr:hypothetical protein N7522_002346 [Penicillium canescens]
MDEGLAPNLAVEAINIQTKESFERWLDYHFPSYVASFNSRVDVSWMDFVRGKWSSFPQALIWGVRALICLRMGAAEGNREAVMCARHMYSRGIKHLACLLQTPAVLSDETLAAAILLGGYEVLDGSTDRSWIIHSQGIRHLFCARGPSAHASGMGRTLMLCWRPYIVADAFINAMPCFLGDSEWTQISMSKEVAKAEDEQEKGSPLGQTMDYAFNEVAKCPGYLATTKNIVSSRTNVDLAMLRRLIDCIFQSKGNLEHCHGMLGEINPPASFVGVIPSMYATTLVQGSRNGISSAIALLNQLMTVLQSYLERTTRSVMIASPGDKPEQDPWRLVAENQSLEPNTSQSPRLKELEDPDLSTYAIGDLLDKFSLTMGMGSLSPDACGCPQFSAHKA